MPSIASCKADFIKAVTALEVSKGKIPTCYKVPIEANLRHNHEHLFLRQEAVKAYIAELQSAMRTVKEYRQLFLLTVGSSVNAEADNATYEASMQDMRVDDAMLEAESTLMSLQSSLNEVHHLIESFRLAEFSDGTRNDQQRTEATTNLSAKETIISSFASEFRAGRGIAPPPEILAAKATSVAVETTTDIVRQDDASQEAHLATTADYVAARTVTPRVRHLETGIVEIILVDSVGKDLVVELTTKEVVTLPQQPPSLADEDVQFILHHAFDLPACRSESVLPDILIGIDYYWDILSPEAPICLPSGMILSHTRPDPIDMHAADEFSNDETIQRLWSLDALGIVDDHDPSMDSNLARRGAAIVLECLPVIMLDFDDNSVGRAVLPLTQLQTVVTEATLNSQVDMQIPPPPQQSEEFLTASHIMAMWYKETLAVLDQFREVWYNDYLAALRERHQTRSKNARSSPRLRMSATWFS
ncbi:unnamed protein product [Heligmosomoides polygyrus]|uniref:DUF1758 domain-containing protein n=1 Tax=Heligmosomoides polygyrus TaxID=6339 RepID=A0A183FMA7_HELPZ|nr:unnamed protein product [Heligmosomoides polygyrus]